MKLKFPEKVTIGTRTFKVIDSKDSGGDFNWHEGTLRIGVMVGGGQLDRLNIITHEVFEMWAVALYIRYDRPDSASSYEFHFDHQHFTNLCELATKTISEFIK